MSKKTNFIIKLSVAVIGTAAAVFAAIAAGSGIKPDTATCDEVGTYSLAAENNNREAEFLEQFGITVLPESRACEAVTIPPTFNETYEEYNSLQKEIGLDLSRFRGESADKVTYRTDNGSFAVILICGGRVIGGHITSGEYGAENISLSGAIENGQTR